MILRPSWAEEIFKYTFESPGDFQQEEFRKGVEVGSWHYLKSSYTPNRDSHWEWEEEQLMLAGEWDQEKLPKLAQKKGGVLYPYPPPDGVILNNLELAKYLRLEENSPFEVVIPILPAGQKGEVQKLFSHLSKTRLELLMDRGLWLKRGESWVDRVEEVLRPAYLRQIQLPLWKEGLEEALPFLGGWLRRRPGYLFPLYFHRRGRGYRLTSNPIVEKLIYRLPLELLMERGTIPEFGEEFLKKYFQIPLLFPSLFQIAGLIEGKGVDKVPLLVEEFGREIEKLPPEFGYLKPLALSLHRELKFYFPKREVNRFILYFQVAQFLGERGELGKGLEYLYRSLRRFAYTYLAVHFPPLLQKLVYQLRKKFGELGVEEIGEILLEELYNHPPEGYPFAKRINEAKALSADEYQLITLHLKRKFREPSRWGVEGRIFPNLLGYKKESRALPKVVRNFRNLDFTGHLHGENFQESLKRIFIHYRELLIDPCGDLPVVDSNIPKVRIV
jgi:hypothetical protein